jgi:hypothetical protein
MVGAFVIILDPIFQGLAVSLLFGVGASTVLTLLVIPLLYYRLAVNRRSPDIMVGRGEAVTPSPSTDDVSV